jgi:uncharacterized protein
VLRAVLDTNVIVSGLISPRGPPGRCLARLAAGAFLLVLSPPLIDELRRTLRRPRVRKYLRLSDETLDRLVAQLETLADPVEGRHALEVVLRDPDDAMVLAAALEARADCVVTGDADLLTVGEYEGIPIVSPRAFLALLGG